MQIKVNSGFFEKLVLVSFILTILVVTPYSVTDPMNLPKMLVIGLFGFTCLGFLLQREIVLRLSRVLAFPMISGLFVLQSLLVLFLSKRSLSQGLYGVSGRNTGLVTYLSLLFICLSASVLASEKFIFKFSMVFVIVGCILLIYGVFQFLGLEPFPYINVYENNVFGTFGNPNFQSAFLGIFGTFVFALCFDSKLNKFKRAVLASIVITSVFGIYSTNSWQGFFNLVAGMGVVLVLVLFRMHRNKIASLVLSIGMIGSVIVTLGLLNLGPLAFALSKASLAARRLYWEAAVNLMLKHPLFGVGFDGFGDWYRRGRTEAAASQNAGLISDSAHSVPLDIGSSGGFPLLIIYLSILVLTLISIVKVVRDSSPISIPFVALAASWASYQAQSLISINQIGLGIIGWTLSGLIIGYAWNLSVNLEFKQPASAGRKPKKTVPTFSFLTFAGPLIGLTVGALISLPPFIAANKFYNGLKSSDARIINTNAYLKPLEVRRMLTAASILEHNKFYKESLKIAQSATKYFPDSFEAWTLLSTLTNSSESDKARAKSELRRLDPNLAS